jgi:hypothetical protein
VTFAPAVARTGQADRFLEFRDITAMAMGPAFVREKKAKATMIDCKFGPGFLESRGKPVQAFSSPICAEAKVEFRQCLNGTMLGSYQYPNCQ